MVDDVLRMRATVVNEEALANIRAIGREIGILPQKGKQATKEMATGFAALAESIKKVGTEIKAVAPGLTGFGIGAASAGLAIKSLIGTLGAISSKIVELKYASKELGMSERDIRAWGITAQKAGLSTESLMQGFKAFRQTTEEMKYHVGAARDELLRMGAGPVVQRMEMAKTMGEKLKVAFDFKEVLEKNDPTGFKARMFFQQIGLGADAARLSLEDYNREQAKLRDRSPEDIANAKKFHDALIDMGKAWDGLLTKVGIDLFPQLTTTLKEITAIIDGLKWVEDWINRVTGGTKGSDPIGNLATGALRKTLPGFAPQTGGATGGWGPADSAAVPRSQPSAGPNTDGGSKEDRGPGTKPAGSTATPAPTGGATRGDRNNNPGNLKFTPHTAAFGAVGADDKGFAIFPNRQSGEAAQETLLASNRYKGLTLDQFGTKYAEGSKDWKATVGREMGLKPGDIVPNQDPRLAGAIRKAEGTAPNGQARGATVGPDGTAVSGVGGFNFMGSARARAMGMNIAPGSPEAHQTFETGIPRGQGPTSIQANKYAGADMAGFLKDLHEAGAPLGDFSGVYANRMKRGGGGASQHAYGNAMDIETGFGSGPDNSAKLYAWAKANPEKFAEIQSAHHMRNLYSPTGKKDWGHFEWTPTGRIDRANDAPNMRADGSVKVDITSNGTAAKASTSTAGRLFSKTTIAQHKQMQPTTSPADRINAGHEAFNQ